MKVKIVILLKGKIVRSTKKEASCQTLSFEQFSQTSSFTQALYEGSCFGSGENDYSQIEKLIV